jgi:uncharacterized protein YecE (DUF72 family)
MIKSGTIRAGIGGWTFAPWEGTFYPDKLAKTKQLAFAASKLKTIEVNGTYYSGFTPATYAKWATETPADFVFSIKGNRFVTNRKVLADAGESMKKFFAQGLEELGPKLGPLVWQFANTKKLEPDDFEAFLNLLPDKHAGLKLRHVVEVRHPTFVVPEFPALCSKYGVAICHADHAAYPEIADVTADFVYSRLQKGNDDIPTAYDGRDLGRWCGIANQWAQGFEPDGLVYADPVANAPVQPRDVFVYFIHEGKVRAPQGAMAFQALADGKD